MPKKTIIDKGRVFQAILDDDPRWNDGDTDITYYFRGNTRDRQQDVDLLNALWDVLEGAFEDTV